MEVGCSTVESAEQRRDVTGLMLERYAPDLVCHSTSGLIEEFEVFVMGSMQIAYYEGWNEGVKQSEFVPEERDTAERIKTATND